MKNALYLSLICCVLAFGACNENKKAKNYNGKTQVDDQGLGFIKDAHEAGLTEIATARMVQTKSSNAKVIQFAKMMITDHTTSDKELQDIANSKFVTIQDVISLDHQAKIKELSQLSGAAFDKGYMQMMVDDHAKVIELFRSVTVNNDSKLNNFSVKTMPALEMHLNDAKAILSSLK